MNGGDRHLEDCYYYLYSNCKRGQDCTFRHNPDARTSAEICLEWERTRRCTVDCPLRHNTYQVQRKKTDEYCYFEDKEQGCTKPFCEFRHKNPEKDAWKVSRSQSGFGESSLIPQEGDSGRRWMNDGTRQDEASGRQLSDSVYQEYDLVDSNGPALGGQGMLSANGSRYWARGSASVPGSHHTASKSQADIISSGVASQGTATRDQHPHNARNESYATPGIVEHSEERSHARPSMGDDYKKPKPNTFDADDRRKKDVRLTKQYTARTSEQRDRPRSRRDDRTDQSRGTAEPLDSDKSYFKKIRMENKTLLNEIDDVEREIEEVEDRASHESYQTR